MNNKTEESALARQEGGSHYKEYAIQPVEFIHANNIPFLEGNVIKYVTRHKKKNGIEDLKKAKHYIDLLIQMEYESGSNNNEGSKEESPRTNTSSISVLNGDIYTAHSTTLFEPTGTDIKKRINITPTRLKD